ncbi:hypothetical protein [Aeromonas veronii]|uniref:hypothetical protein n=1 Tax=Aeromonas veronii TaxID=654 RepID=UPI0011C022C7|nr:hypothetical protein [Aeromonas veronii]
MPSLRLASQLPNGWALPVRVDPARGTPVGRGAAAGPPAVDRLGALGGHCWGRQSALCPRGTLPVLVDPARGTPAGRGLRLAHHLPIGSVPRVVTAGADDPARGVPARPMPTAGPPAADQLDVRGLHCRGR